MDGEDGTATEFEERLNLLKAIGDPIFFRLALSSEKMMTLTDEISGSVLFQLSFSYLA